MRSAKNRPVLSALSALSAAALGLLGPLGPAQPAAAETPALSFAVDRAEAVPGSTVTVTMAFTNTETTDVQFVYQSFQRTWSTSIAPGLRYAFTSCAGEGATCTVGDTGNGGDGAPQPRYTAPVPPGETRTVTAVYEIAPDSSCGAAVEVGFYSYFYYEYAGGLSTRDGIVDTPVTRVVCP